MGKNRLQAFETKLHLLEFLRDAEGSQQDQDDDEYNRQDCGCA